MTLDFSPLFNALARLEEGLERYQRDVSDAQIRDGLIQRFEFTYDIAHKQLRSALEERAASLEEIDRLGFPDLVRTANEQGLLKSDWSQWRSWREMRSLAPHINDQAKAVRVTATIPAFVDEARELAERLLACCRET